MTFDIWDRKSFEVGGHWPLWRGWKNRMITQNRQKSNAKKKKKKKYHLAIVQTQPFPPMLGFVDKALARFNCALFNSHITCSLVPKLKEKELQTNITWRKNFLVEFKFLEEPFTGQTCMICKLLICQRFVRKKNRCVHYTRVCSMILIDMFVFTASILLLSG